MNPQEILHQKKQLLRLIQFGQDIQLVLSAITFLLGEADYEAALLR
ncbi:MAG: hypothetical protein MI748_01450 [Opitutales bacterium]|nr:hypothetical protein [Opitutales bacterium]